MNKNSSIYIADHENSHGLAIKNKLETEGYTNLVLKSRFELNLKDPIAVANFFKSVKPEYVFLTAGKSGSIMENAKYPVDFLMENLQFQTSVIPAAAENGVKKLLFIGSSCMYPKDPPQPIKETSLLNGDFEETSEATSIAKIAGYGFCRAYSKQFDVTFISAVPATTYGPDSNFNPQSAHVASALITKFHEAKKNGDAEVILWGTGQPLREFLYNKDFAEACVFLMNTYDSYDLINIGSGAEISIRELALKIKNVVGFEGNIKYDESKPDGVMRKILDSSKINNLGWKAKIGYDEGLKLTYDWYLAQATSDK